MKRYDIKGCYSPIYGPVTRQEQKEDGKWVKYEDAKWEIEQLKGVIKKAHQRVSGWDLTTEEILKQEIDSWEDEKCG